MMRFTSLLVLALLVLCRPLAQAADAALPVGIVPDPCPAPVTMPDGVRDLLTRLFMETRTLAPEDIRSLVSDPAFAAFNVAGRGLGAQDWPNLCRFRAANAAVLASGQRPDLVFMGDSITENWLLGDPELFDAAWINRGIGGQTTPQMLLRFQADVIALRPRAVDIMAGTNDVAGNTGPTTMQDIKNNLMSMVELARAQGVEVFVASIPPAAAFDWRPGLDPRPFITELNSWLREYAAEQGLAYLDYHAALADENGALRSAFGNDGVHPNRAGYAVMRRVLETVASKQGP